MSTDRLSSRSSSRLPDAAGTGMTPNDRFMLQIVQDAMRYQWSRHLLLGDDPARVSVCQQRLQEALAAGLKGDVAVDAAMKATGYGIPDGTRERVLHVSRAAEYWIFGRNFNAFPMRMSMGPLPGAPRFNSPEEEVEFSMAHLRYSRGEAAESEQQTNPLLAMMRDVRAHKSQAGKVSREVLEQRIAELEQLLKDLTDDCDMGGDMGGDIGGDIGDGGSHASA